MNFIVKNNGQLEDIAPNEDIAVGFYDEYGFKSVLKMSNGDIERTDVGKYRAFVSSDVTKNFIGNVDVEIVVYDEANGYDERNVSHADKVLKMYFEERKINEDI